MIEKLKAAMEWIDEDLIRRWVKDLIFTKTYAVLRFQASILKRISKAMGMEYHVAKPEEETKGIDGFVGDIPVSIKPITYNLKKCYQKTLKSK